MDDASHLDEESQWVGQLLRMLGPTDRIDDPDAHPDAESIASLADGALEEDQENAIRSHLLWCEECSGAYFGVLAALDSERFWEGLRASVEEFEDSLESAPRPLAARAGEYTAVRGKVVQPGGTTTPCFLTATHGPTVDDRGRFEVRLVIPNETGIEEGEALLRFYLGRHRFWWRAPVHDGIIEFEKQFEAREPPRRANNALAAALEVTVSPTVSRTDPLEQGDELAKPLDEGYELAEPGHDKQLVIVRDHALDPSEAWSSLLRSLTEEDIEAILALAIQVEERERAPFSKKGRCKERWLRAIRSDQELERKFTRLAHAYMARLSSAVSESEQIPRYAMSQDDEHPTGVPKCYVVDHAGVIVIAMLFRREGRRRQKLQIKTGFRPTFRGSNAAAEAKDFFRAAVLYVVEHELDVGPVPTASPPYYFPSQWLAGLVE